MENSADIEGKVTSEATESPTSKLREPVTTGQLLCGGHNFFGSSSKSSTTTPSSHSQTPVTTGALIFGGDRKWLQFIKKRSHHLANDTKNGLKSNEIEFNFMVQSKLKSWLPKLINNSENSGGNDDGREDERGIKHNLDRIDEQEENEEIIDKEKYAEIDTELQKEKQHVFGEVQAHLVSNQFPDKACGATLSNPVQEFPDGEGTILIRKPTDLHLEINDWNNSVMKNMCDRDRALKKARLCLFCNVSDSDEANVDDDNYVAECLAGWVPNHREVI